jgi:putative membrane protein
MQQPANNPQPPFSAIRIFFTGFAMGIADLIPGVSGGTMAFILGIYERLLAAIKSFDLQLVRLLLKGRLREAMAQIPWAFLIPLGLGLGAAVLSMARVMRYLLENQPVYLFSFFFGLIIASIIAVGATVRWTPTSGLALVIGTVAAFLIVGLVPLSMPNDPLTLFLSGVVAIMAMILPGISGSFILLILGQYAFVLNAVSDFNLLAIIPVGLGAVVGLLGFARVLSWLLAHYHNVTVAVLVGFMLGSLRKIWPWKEVIETMIDRHGEVVPMRERNILPDFAGPEPWFALGLALVGFLLLSFIDHLQTGANPIFRPLLGRRVADPDPVAKGT